MDKVKVSKVFVPGGMPSVTYVPRSERKLEETLHQAADNLCKLVTVTGATKSGKTVLTNKVFPRISTVWVDGGTATDEDALWTEVLTQLNGYSELTDQVRSQTTKNSGIKAKVEGGLPLFTMAGIEFDTARGSTKEKMQSGRLTLSPRGAAINALRKAGKPLIIDDFHYLPRELQGHVIRALKPLIFDGLPVILIAIPHRRFDAVKVEREMTGRLESITIPPWNTDELIKIPNEGFPLLNVKVEDNLTTSLAGNAYGSPHLMQEFCKALAKAKGIDETSDYPIAIIEVTDGLFSSVAEGTGKVIFDKLAKGPRQRTDRLTRKLVNGSTADIYNVVLLALAELGPGLDTIEYETLRSAIRRILAENAPRAHEVTRVIEKMANIAASDEASTPVLDWEKGERKLHITDPFFAFFLKWGMPKVAAQAPPLPSS